MVAARATPAVSRGPDADNRFRGWPPGVPDFFDDLEMDNTKTFWAAHKQFYLDSVRRPMEALLAELAPEFGEGRIFRPYRDTRFSPDKSPYKITIAGHNDAGYFSLSADALGVGSGLYQPSSPQLARFRAAVADGDTGAQLVDMVKELRARRIQVSAHETLKTAPRGYPGDHPRIELLRHKGLTAWREWTAGPWLSTAAPKRRVVEALRAMAPLREWLDANVGAADRP